MERRLNERARESRARDNDARRLEIRSIKGGGNVRQDQSLYIYIYIRCIEGEKDEIYFIYIYGYT